MKCFNNSTNSTNTSSSELKLTILLSFSVVFGTITIIVNTLCLIFYLKNKESILKWTFQDFDTCTIIVIDILLGFVNLIDSSIALIEPIFNQDLYMTVILCLNYFFMMDLSKYMLLTAFERLIAIKFRRRLKKLSLKSEFYLRLFKLSLRLVFGLTFLIFSFSPLIFCYEFSIDIEYYLISNSIIIFCIISTAIIYLFMLFFILKEKKRKIDCTKQNKCAFSSTNQKIIRLNLLKKQVIFFFAISFTILPVVFTTTIVSLVKKESLEISPEQLIIFGYIAVILALFAYNVEPLMYFLSYISLKRKLLI
jgi:hypothetical protein